jgi:signal transduction histidine kinase
VNLAACVKQATRLISTKAAEKQVAMLAHGSEAASVTGASGLLFRLIANLLKNAVEAAPAGSQVTVAWQSTADGWELSVGDSGAGIPAEARAQMLATRFREKPASLAGRGTGLGLAICRAVTRLHHGRLHLLCHAPHGTLIRVELPSFR